MHSLAHVMNRTRRRDIGRFTIREPQTVSVAFTSEQRRLYEAVLAFRREVLLQDYDPQVVRLILDTLERQAVSCINAIGQAIGKILETGGFSAQISPTTQRPKTLGSHAVFGARRSTRPRGRGWWAVERGPEVRSAPRDRVHDAGRPHGPGKILVFSFFLNTIGYLERRLGMQGSGSGS